MRLLSTTSILISFLLSATSFVAADQLPDIQDGFIYNDIKGGDKNPNRNVFVTEIQGMLYSKDRSYVLSHECRGENINLIDGKNLLKQKGYEFVAMLQASEQVTTAKVFRRVSAFNVNPMKNSPPMELVSTYKDHESHYKAPLRDVEYMDFDQLEDALLADQINVRNLFAKYTLNYNDEIFTLLVPVHYLNFPKQKRDSNNYLQPMSGAVPLLYNNEVTLGYIVSLVRDGSVVKIEAALNEKLNLIDALNTSPFFTPKDKSLKEKFKPIVRWFYSVMLLPVKNIYHFFSYSRAVELKGDVVFYRYK